MADTFKVGDRVGWNSEAGHVSVHFISFAWFVGFILAHGAMG
jgi:hypothetical protein